MNPDARALERRARRAGLLTQRRSNSHYLVLTADGTPVGMIPGSPSDSHSLRNSMAEIRRNSGIDLRPSAANKGRRRPAGKGAR